MAEQVDLDVVDRRKVAVAAFTRQRPDRSVAAEECRHAESTPGRDHRHVAGVCMARLQRHMRIRTEFRHCPGKDLDVIEQRDPWKLQQLTELRTFDGPREVRGRDAVVEHRTGHAEACCVERRWRGAEE